MKKVETSRLRPTGMRLMWRPRFPRPERAQIHTPDLISGRLIAVLRRRFFSLRATLLPTIYRASDARIHTVGFSCTCRKGFCSWPLT